MGNVQTNRMCDCPVGHTEAMGTAGAPRYHLVILREMLALNDTGHGIKRCRCRNYIRVEDIRGWMTIDPPESSEVLIDCLKVLGPILGVHD